MMFWLICAVSPTLAQTTAPPAGTQPPDFAKQVYPLLRRACFECHGAAKQSGDLRLDSRQAIADSGVVKVGDPQASELVRRIGLPKGHAEIMPA
ncbi:MAG: hypothetical protein IT423_20225, partial [Pirellulaceae bacterium]|nr:hypothetical protein [Pirellulaceae bacterium]